MFLPQMPTRTRGQDAAGTSGGRDATPNPPPVPPTLAEAIAALDVWTPTPDDEAAKSNGKQE